MSVIKKLFLLLLLSISGPLLLLAQNLVYHKISLSLEPGQGRQLQELGLMPDHGHQHGNHLIAEFSQADLDQLASKGFQWTMIQQDMSAWYANRLAQAPQYKISATQAPAGFNLGSMGGYLTFEEVKLELDSMAMMYPNLISVKDSIGHSIEGRAIWMVKISDNVLVDENEPEVLYTGLHHAREPMSMTNLVYFMYYILENYGTDLNTTYLMDHRELFFIPVVNPDGYIYNQSTDPGGGGLWRKNRRSNSGTFGVDLNRNYGYQWAYNNTGSSPNQSSQTFRGASAFSEPETQAVRDFCEGREIKTGFNYHSYGNLLIRPWGFSNSYPMPDLSVYNAFATVITEENHYLAGDGLETVGYQVNGDSDDWMYGEQSTKDKMLIFTPEVGGSTDGFWPAVSRIVPLCEENLLANYRIAWLAADFVHTEPDAERFLEGASIEIPVDYKNIGLADADAFTAEFISTDPNISNSSPLQSFAGLLANSEVRDTFILALQSNIPLGTKICGLVRTSLASGVIREDSVCFIYGIPEEIFLDEVLSFPFHWAGGWNTTTEKSFTGVLSLTDSPFADYSNNQVNELTLTNPIDLSNHFMPMMTFMATWKLETGFDFVQVSGSADGQNFQALQGTRSVLGTGIFQPVGEPVFDGLNQEWEEEFFDLSPFAGGQVYLRFTLKSDNWFNREGFFFDDLRVLGYSLLDGIEGLHWGQSLFLYPNPANFNLMVGGNLDGQNFDLNCFDLQGKMILQQRVQLGDQVELDKMPPGLYFYRFNLNGEFSQLKKLVIH